MQSNPNKWHWKQVPLQNKFLKIAAIKITLGKQTKSKR